MVRWAAGDHRAAAELIDRHTGPLRRFFRTKTNGDIEDLIQQTLETCLRARDRIPNAASFRAYMYSVARNVLFNHYRRRRRSIERFDPLETSVAALLPSPSQMIAAQERRGRLAEAMQQLPLDLQVALELRYWEQLTGPELADVLEIPEGTVRSRLRRAMAMLRELLGDQMYSERELSEASGRG